MCLLVPSVRSTHTQLSKHCTFWVFSLVYWYKLMSNVRSNKVIFVMVKYKDDSPQITQKLNKSWIVKTGHHQLFYILFWFVHLWLLFIYFFKWWPICPSRADSCPDWTQSWLVQNASSSAPPSRSSLIHARFQGSFCPNGVSGTIPLVQRDIENTPNGAIEPDWFFSLCYSHHSWYLTSPPLDPAHLLRGPHPVLSSINHLFVWTGTCIMFQNVNKSVVCKRIIHLSFIR